MIRTSRGRIASFCYGEEKIELIPGRMSAVGNSTYELIMPDGLCASLAVNAVGESALCVLLEFEHRGKDNSAQISCIRSLDISLSAGYAIWRSFTGDSCGEKSFQPIEKTFIDGDLLHLEPTGGRSSNTSAFPFFDLTCGGQTYVFGVGWSGQWCADICQSKSACQIQIGLQDADFYLKPGEKVRGVRVLCVCGADVTSARQNFRRIMRAYFSPKVRLKENMRLPIAIQPFDRYFFNPNVNMYKNGRPEWATENGQKYCADAALKCGYIDTLWLDAAWFKDGFPCGVGNYSFAEGFPKGLRSVSDYAHQKGMKFMLWFEPERIHCGSELFRDHRDMVLSYSERYSEHLFNLADEKAHEWLKDRLIDFIQANGIDIYRQDFNMDPLPYWRENDEPGRRGFTEIKYIEGLYRLWDALTEAFPALLIDNCASGGRRIDLETCMRAVPLWRSDTGCFPVSEKKRGHTWSQNHILALSQYLPYHASATWESSAYHVRSVQSGGIACNFDVLNDAFDYKQAQRVLSEVVYHREYWMNGDFYPLSEITNSEEVWAAWQVAKDDSGAAYAFRRDACAQAEYTLRLHEIDAQATYEVMLTDEEMNVQRMTMRGKELTNLTVRCGKAGQSAAVEYHKNKYAGK